jgi:hypothetical protein
MKHTLTACILGAVLLVGGSVAQAADNGPAATATSNATAKRAKQMPFRGKITAVDTTAKTLTLSGKQPRTMRLTATTRIQRDGKPARIEDLRAGETVGGLAKANDAGEWEIATLNIGQKSKAPKPDEAGTETAME